TRTRYRASDGVSAHPAPGLAGPVPEAGPGNPRMGFVQGRDVDAVAGSVEEGPHRVHVGIADRTEGDLLMADVPPQDLAQGRRHIHRGGSVTGQLDALSQEGTRGEHHLRRERAEVGTRQLLQRPLGGQWQIENAVEHPLVSAERVVEEVGRPQDRVRHVTGDQVRFDARLALEMRYATVLVGARHGAEHEVRHPLPGRGGDDGPPLCDLGRRARLEGRGVCEDARHAVHGGGERADVVQRPRHHLHCLLGEFACGPPVRVTDQHADGRPPSEQGTCHGPALAPCRCEDQDRCVGHDERTPFNNPLRERPSLAQEGDERGVHFLGVGPQQPVRGALDLDVVRGRQHLVEEPRGSLDRQDPVARTVQDQGWYVDGGDVGPEVGRPREWRGRSGVEAPARGDVPAVAHRLFADAGAQVLVQVVEVLVEGRVIGVAVSLHRRDHTVEELLRSDAVRIVVGLEEAGLERGEERGLGHPAGTIGGEVAGDFAGTHREPDQDGVAEVESLHDGVQVGGEGVVVVTARRLGRLPETATVVGDDPVTGVQQSGALSLPRVPVQRKAVDEHDGLPGTVVLVVEIDVGGVLLANCDVRHMCSSVVNE
ncbi:hypothetical protein STRIP9103_07447, partial [Streptomyces ipomoeae 91-03]